MSMLLLASACHSPGVTGLGVALALTWPGPVLLVDAPVLVLPTLPPVAWLAVLRVLLSASDWPLLLFGLTVTAPVDDVLAPVWAV